MRRIPDTEAFCHVRSNSKNGTHKKKMLRPPEVLCCDNWNLLEKQQAQLALPLAIANYFESTPVFIPQKCCTTVIQNAARTWYPPFGAFVYLAKNPPNLNDLTGYKFAYHGTSVQSISSILGGTAELQFMDPVQGHKPTGAIWVSPSSLYASHEVYAKPFKHTNGVLTCFITYFLGGVYRYVLQMLVHPDWSKVGKGGEYDVTVQV